MPDSQKTRKKKSSLDLIVWKEDSNSFLSHFSGFMRVDAWMQTRQMRQRNNENDNKTKHLCSPHYVPGTLISTSHNLLSVVWLQLYYKLHEGRDFCFVHGFIQMPWTSTWCLVSTQVFVQWINWPVNKYINKRGTF